MRQIQVQRQPIDDLAFFASSRCTALICALVLAVSLAGCSDDSKECPVSPDGSTPSVDGGSQVNPPHLDGGLCSDKTVADCRDGSVATTPGADARVEELANQLARYASCGANVCVTTRWECDESSTGACTKFTACLDACGCGDLACARACGTPSSGCTSCWARLDGCTSSACRVESCTFPDLPIYGAVRTSGARGLLDYTCGDLQACCNGLTPGGADACRSEYQLALPQGDLYCSLALMSLRDRGICPQ